MVLKTISSLTIKSFLTPHPLTILIFNLTLFGWVYLDLDNGDRNLKYRHFATTTSTSEIIPSGKAILLYVITAQLWAKFRLYYLKILEVKLY